VPITPYCETDLPGRGGRVKGAKRVVKLYADGTSVRLQIWSWKKRLISQARISVRAGPVTVRLPFSAGYKAGQYDPWAYVTGAGEKKYKLLHWKVRVP
jgi:hypothetical protein